MILLPVEDEFTYARFHPRVQTALNSMDSTCQSAAALGITITVASGDNGSTDGETGALLNALNGNST